MSNDKYSLGSTGGMIYVYDGNGRELTKIKTMNYTYELVFFLTVNDLLLVLTRA